MHPSLGRMVEKSQLSTFIKVPKPVTAVNSKAGTWLSTAARHRVDIARLKGHPTPAGIPSYKPMQPWLSASTGHAQRKTCTSMCPNMQEQLHTLPRCSPSSVTAWYQALLLLEAARVLVWTCTLPVLRAKHVHELFTGICKISFENHKITVWWQAGQYLPWFHYLKQSWRISKCF